MADNITILDGAAASKNWATTEGSDSQHRQHTVPTDGDGNAAVHLEDAAHTTGDAGIQSLAVRKDTAAALAGTDGDYTPLIVDSSGRLHTAPSTGATDDAAAAGQIYPLAGLLDNTSTDEVDEGDLGRVRITPRRALMTGSDGHTVYANEIGMVGAGDLEVSDSGIASGYAAPTVAFFDGTDGGFGAADRYIKIPMIGWKSVSVVINHTLDVSIGVYLHAWVRAANSYAVKAVLHDTGFTVATTEEHIFTPKATATAAKYHSIPAMEAPMEALIVHIDPAGDATSGALRITVRRQS